LDEFEVWAEFYNHWMNRPRWQKVLSQVLWYLTHSLLGVVFAKLVYVNVI